MTGAPLVNRYGIAGSRGYRLHSINLFSHGSIFIWAAQGMQQCATQLAMGPFASAQYWVRATTAVCGSPHRAFRAASECRRQALGQPDFDQVRVNPALWVRGLGPSPFAAVPPPPASCLVQHWGGTLLATRVLLHGCLWGPGHGGAVASRGGPGVRSSGAHVLLSLGRAGSNLSLGAWQVLPFRGHHRQCTGASWVPSSWFCIWCSPEMGPLRGFGRAASSSLGVRERLWPEATLAMRTGGATSWPSGGAMVAESSCTKPRPTRACETP